jgi:hypothetical protein
MGITWWNKNKMSLAPVAAILLWSVSVICFVFGLSFNQPFMIYGFDSSWLIALALSLCNTVIQLVGNDMEFTDKDWVFLWIWRASYVLGVSSNVNSLIQILGIPNVIIEWLVAISLGTIIEVAPERLIIMWLRGYKSNTDSLSTTPKPFNPQNFKNKPNRPAPNSNQFPMNPNIFRELKGNQHGQNQKVN